MVNGKKLIGSAQYRSKFAVLQHGSLPLTPMYRTLPNYLLLSEEQRRHQIALLESKSCALSEVSGSIPYSALISGLKEGFISTFGGTYIERAWQENELDKIVNMMERPSFQRRWLH
jgi:lipoate-protein ligase A